MTKGMPSTFTRPVTVYAVAAIFRRPDGTNDLFNRFLILSGVNPLTNEQAEAAIVAEVVGESPGLVKMHAVVSRLNIG